MAGYRITARALDSRFVGEQILKEYTGLEDCELRGKDVELEAPRAHKIVFVLEEEPDGAPEGRSPPRHIVR